MQFIYARCYNANYSPEALLAPVSLVQMLSEGSLHAGQCLGDVRDEAAALEQLEYSIRGVS